MIIKKIKARNGFTAICKCDYCSKEFKRKLTWAKKFKRHFCNNKCQGNYFSGENNCNFERIFSPETIRKMRNAKLGKRTGKNCPFYGVHRYGKEHPCWKGGIKHCNGRIYIMKKNHPHIDRQGYILRSRLVMENHLGRYLKLEEVVHHINGNVSDDGIENLELTTNEEHSRYHTQLRWNKNIFVRDCHMLRNEKGQFIGKELIKKTSYR